MVDVEGAGGPRAGFPSRHVSLHDIPSAVIGLVAAYLKPPEVYHLLTSLENDGKCHSRSLSPFCDPPASRTTTPLLSPHSALSSQSQSILAASLDESLKGALEKNRVGSRKDINTHSSFARLAAELGPRQPQGSSPRLSLGLTRGLEWKSAAVAISGGIMVQTVLGETWKGSDIDVYCTEGAAAAARAWLISDMKQVLVGVNSRRKDVVSWSLKDPVVDHIEYWANTPPDGEQFKHVRGRWEFDYEEACIDSPVGFQGNAVFDGAETIDDDFHGFVMTTKGDIRVPFEPRLLYTLDSDGSRKTKKDVVGIDLIVVKEGHTIVDAIENFDLDICQCSWDGLGSFHVPAPGNTFCRVSGLNNGQEVSNKVLLYAKCITVESQKTFREMKKAFRAKHGELHMMLWEKQLKHLQATNEEYAELFVQLELVIDTFNVFSPEFDVPLPVDILWLTRELREMLIQNVLGRPGAFGHEEHNYIVKSFERPEKYERRGITVKPRPFQSVALRTLPTHGKFFSASNLSSLGISMKRTSRMSPLDRWATSECSVTTKVALKPVGISSYRQRWSTFRQLVVRAQQTNAASTSKLAAATPKGATAQIGPRRKKTKVMLPLLPEKETGRSAGFLPRHHMPHCSKSKNADRFNMPRSLEETGRHH
jgi:hypothetical protein